MRIAFDQQIFLRQRVGGASRYVCELARHLARVPDTQPWVVAPLHINDYLGSVDGVRVTGQQVPIHPRLVRHMTPLVEARAARVLRRRPPDVVHETYYAAHTVAPRGVPVVLTVHDMIHERFPELYARDDRTRADKRAAVARADHVVCISRATLDDVCERLDLPPERASVVHHGHSMRPELGAGLPPPVSGPYVLYVGQRGAQKNFTVLVEAYARSAPLRRELRLVCFGGGPFDVAEQACLAAAGLGAGEAVQVSGDDGALAAAYRHALVLVFPSRYEGFGLPVLEAMALGCPVLAGDCAPLREVGGGAALYLDPDQPDAWAATLMTLAGNTEQRESLRAAGLQRAAEFTWERCARHTRAVYAALTAAVAA